MAPPAQLLRATLPCGSSVDNVTAIQACEAAANECGYGIVSRTRRSVLLMPLPKRALLPRLTTSCCTGGVVRGEGGYGIAAELVPNDDGDLAISVATPSCKRSKEFVSALSLQLEELGGGAAVAPQEEADFGGSAFKRKVQAYYLASKLLCDVQLEPGMAAAAAVEAFVGKWTPEGGPVVCMKRCLPMVECLAEVDRLAVIVEAHLERTASPTDAAIALQLAPWIRGSVERCVFARLGGTLRLIYRHHHAEDDSQYERKANALAALSDVELFEELDVRAKFRGAPGGFGCESTLLGKSSADTISNCADKQSVKCDDLDSLRTPSTAACSNADEEATLMSWPSRSEHFSAFTPARPYERAAAALSQLEAAVALGCGQTPKEALKALTLAQFEMRTCALESSGGQAELQAMDDLLPVFIFVLVRSSLTRPFACAGFIGDALSNEDEGRAVLLLESAARYIAHEWTVEGLEARAAQSAPAPDAPASTANATSTSRDSPR
eukprot:TRINITY_DN13682_c0_g1_i1.p1 TRINITY_DN13682_c0_g1~~TRINITY_DN13682_c0_g1_i1.p1  ORF type:complete len:496 (-),score=85.75 TRINITY_DN13682_c0_g1_i1:112-1599(-)